MYVVFQPRVETPFPEGIADVQRTFLVLHPDGRDRFRRILLGHKRLPDPGGGGWRRRERFWSYVDRAGKLSHVSHDLGASTYMTRTRGLRFQPAARVLTQGSYVIAEHGDHTHFSYALDAPETVGPIHDDLGMCAVASYLLLGMRPWPGERGARVWHRIPEHLRAPYQDKRFAPLKLPLLDFEGVSLVLVGVGRYVDPALAPVLQSVPRDLAEEQRVRAALEPAAPPVLEAPTARA